jgi:DHA1 family tetracycline resistance protein-like MFS transporter
LGRYGWSSLLVGISLGFVGIVLATAQIYVLPRAIARFGERQTAIIGICGAAIAMTGFALAEQGWLVFILLPVMASQALVHPNLTAMMTRRATASTQGEVQGFASGVMALGSLSAPLLYNPLLSWFTGGAANGVWGRSFGAPPFMFWGAAFGAAALCAILALFVLVRIKSLQNTAQNQPEN